MRFFSPAIFICFFSFYFTNAQSPGGIAANNTVWLKADLGLTSSSNIISQWQELSGANVTGNFTVQSLTGTVNTQTSPTLIDAGINFNPYVRFDGFTNSLSSVNLFPGTSLVSNNNVTVFQVFNLRGGIVWLKWETDQVGATGRLGFENSTGTIRFDFPKAVPATAGQNIGTINVLNQHSLATSYADAALSVNRLNGATNTTLAIPGPGDFAAMNDKLVIGNENLINLPAQVDIAEIIIYAATLSPAERNKIESYLAIKYGFTLDQAPANLNDYTSSNGTIIWDRNANSGYANNITGVGRDDASALSQKQSKSINSTALITLYNGQYSGGNFPLLNSANTSDFSADRSFILAGDNGQTTAMDRCIMDGRAIAMKRTWKVSAHGQLTSPVTISADNGSIPLAAVKLIVSQDPSFPSVSSTVYSLTSANNKLYTDASFTDGDYFTFATDPELIIVAGTNPTCANPSGGGAITTISGGVAPLSFSWLPSGQLTANLVNVAAGIHVLTITQGACQHTEQITLVNPSAIPTPAAAAVTVCTGNTATMSVSVPNASYIYNWYAVQAGGTLLASGTSFTTPVLISSTTYYLEAVSGTCRSIRIPVAVTITTVTAPFVNGVTVCQGNTAVLTIQSPLAGYSYNWYTSATGGSALGSGASFTTNAINSTTTYYAEAVLGTCNSIRTPIIINVNIIAAPVAAPVSVCAGSGALLIVQAPNAAYTYDWYAASTGGISLASGTSFNTPNITGVITYYVEASGSGCSSLRTAVTVSLVALPDTPAVRVTAVTGNSVSFSWSGVAGATGYQLSVDGAAYSATSNELTYTVTGLTKSQTVQIRVIAIGPPQGCGNSLPGQALGTTYGDDFYVPSAFTPNADTWNDVMRPMIPGGSILDYFTIFNRWGQKVFTTNVEGVGWNGKVQGSDQPAGIYVWICRYRFPGKLAAEEKGTFYLLH